MVQTKPPSGVLHPVVKFIDEQLLTSFGPFALGNVPSILDTSMAVPSTFLMGDIVDEILTCFHLCGGERFHFGLCALHGAFDRESQIPHLCGRAQSRIVNDLSAISSTA